MLITFIPPSPETLSLWNKGDPLTDTQLAELEQFFAAIVKGAEALGERFSLATIALRMEWDRVDRIKCYRTQR